MEDKLGEGDKTQIEDKTRIVGKIQVEGKIHPMVHMDHAETSHGDYDDRDDDT